jgi:hypothetical protein
VLFRRAVNVVRRVGAFQGGEDARDLKAIINGDHAR